MITEVLPPDPTIEQIRDVCAKLYNQTNEKGYRAKFTVEFTKPTSVIRGGHWVTLDKMTVYTFKTKTGRYCYTFRSHYGWGFDQIDFVNIKSISIPTYEEATHKSTVRYLSNIKKALSLIHPNAWDDLKVQLMETPSNYENYGSFLKIVTEKKYKGIRDDEYHTVYKCVFPDYVREGIQKAFDNRTDFRYDYERRNCSVSVECKVQPNGFIKAWYTRTLKEPKRPSKYSSGGRDFCYLLLNPTTAWFVKRD